MKDGADTLVEGQIGLEPFAWSLARATIHEGQQMTQAGPVGGAVAAEWPQACQEVRHYIWQASYSYVLVVLHLLGKAKVKAIEIGDHRNLCHQKEVP
jgi:hypothetical protein